MHMDSMLMNNIFSALPFEADYHHAKEDYEDTKPLDRTERFLKPEERYQHDQRVAAAHEDRIGDGKLGARQNHDVSGDRRDIAGQPQKHKGIGEGMLGELRSWLPADLPDLVHTDFQKYMAANIEGHYKKHQNNNHRPSFLKDTAISSIQAILIFRPVKINRIPLSI